MKFTIVKNVCFLFQPLNAVFRGSLWLFKVNEFGCYTGDNCEEEVSFTVSNNPNKPLLSINDTFLYPNPTSGEIRIRNHKSIETMKIYDLSGLLMLKVQIWMPHIAKRLKY